MSEFCCPGCKIDLSDLIANECEKIMAIRDKEKAMQALAVHARYRQKKKRNTRKPVKDVEIQVEAAASGQPAVTQSD